MECRPTLDSSSESKIQGWINLDHVRAPTQLETSSVSNFQGQLEEARATTNTRLIKSNAQTISLNGGLQPFVPKLNWKNGCKSGLAGGRMLSHPYSKPKYDSQSNETRDKSGVVLIVDGGKQHGNVLIVKGKDTIDGIGKWGLPKGSIKIGETPYNAAVREMEEETGVLVSGEYQNFSSNVYGDQHHYFVFKMPYFTINEKMDNIEIKEMKYVSWEKFGEMYGDFNSYTKGFIRKFYKNIPVTLLCKSSKTTLQDMCQDSVVSDTYQQARILDLEYKSQNAPMVVDEVQDQYENYFEIEDNGDSEQDSLPDLITDGQEPVFENNWIIQPGWSLYTVLEEDEYAIDDNYCVFDFDENASECEDFCYDCAQRDDYPIIDSDELSERSEKDSDCSECEFYVSEKFPDRIDFQYSGVGVFINDHMWGRGFQRNATLFHSHGCDEYCSVCYPMNSSVYENADVGIREKVYEREFCDQLNLCYCDGIAQVCDKHYFNKQVTYSAQMNNYSRHLMQDPIDDFTVQVKNKPIGITRWYNTCDAGKINIMNLRQYFATLRHGDKKQVLQKLLKYVNDDFFLTHAHNTEKDYVWLFKQYKFYNIKSSIGSLNRKARDRKYKYQAQMFSCFREAISTLRETRETMLTVRNAAGKVDAAMDYIPKLTGSLVAFSKGIGAGLVKVFIQLFSSFYLLSQPCNQNPANITAILTSSLVGIVPANDLIDRLILAAKTLFGYNAQVGNLNFIGCLIDVIVGTFKATFGALDVVAVSDFSVKAKFVQTVTKACSNIKNLVETLTYVIGEVLNYFGDYLVQYYGYVPGFMRDRTVLDNLIRDFRRFQAEDLIEKARIDMKEANFVNGLYMRLVDTEEKYMCKVARNDKSTKALSILPYVRSMKAKVKEAVDMLPPTFRMAGSGRRAKPFWVAITGDPRIGKSTWLQQYLTTQLAKDCRLITDYQDPSTYSFTRTCGQEFWDGYCGQPVIIYDDLFQVYANQEAVFSGIDEITKVVNDAIFQLNMSSIAQKSNTYCTSKIVISNMQSDVVGKGYIMDKCLSKGEHIFARRNVVMELKLDSKYVSPMGVIDQQKFAQAIQDLKRPYVGTSVIYKTIPEDAYKISFSNPRTGAPLAINFNGSFVTDLPVDFAIDCVRKWCAEHFQQSSLIGQTIEDVSKELFQDNSPYTTLFSNMQTTNASVGQIMPLPIPQQQKRSQRKAQMAVDDIEEEDSQDKCDEESVYEVAMQPEIVNLDVQSGIKCMHCSWSFVDNEKYFEHQRHHSFFLKCELCNKDMTNYATYLKHLIKSHEVNPHIVFRKFSIVDSDDNYCCSVAQMDESILREYETMVRINGNEVTSDMRNDFIRMAEANEVMRNFRVLEVDQTSITSLAEYHKNNGVALSILEAYPNLNPHPVDPRHMSLRQYVTYLKKNPTKVPQYEALTTMGDKIQCSCSTMWFESIVPYFPTEALNIADNFLAYEHVCPTSVPQLLQAAKPVQKSVIADYAQECWDSICEGYRIIQDHPLMTLLGVATAILTVAGGVWAWYGSQNKEPAYESQYKGSNGGNNRAKKTERQRARNNEYKRMKGNKSSRYAGTDTIHEVDRSQVVIGRGAQVYTTTNSDVEKLLDHAMGRATIVVQHEGKEYDTDSHVSFVNVWGSIIALPQHFMLRAEQLVELYALKECPAQVFIRFDFDDIRKNVKVMYKEICWMKPSEELEFGPHLVDVAFCHIKGLMMGRDITKHFNSIKDEITLNGCYLYGLRSRAVNNRVVPTMLTVSNTALFQRDIETQGYLQETIDYNLDSAVDVITKATLNKKVISIPWFYTYRSNTVPGDCGMLLIHTDHQVAGKILGFHVAGAQSVHEGVSTPIYYEDLLDVIDWFKTNLPKEKFITKSAEVGYEFKTQCANTEFGTQILSTGIRAMGFVKNMNVLGDAVHITPHITGNSGIKPSVVFDELVKQLGQPKSAPAALRPFTTPSGERISPFVKGIGKMQTHAQRIPQHEVDAIVDHCIESIRNWKSVHMDDMRVLNMEETLNGYDGLKKVDLETSPGVPFKRMAKKPGKSSFINKIIEAAKERYELTPEMENILRGRETAAAEGVIEPTLFVDSLKDETRSIEKVVEGKTRIFQCGPLDLLLLTRKYCGKFISHCHNTYVDGEMAIGVSPYSDAWHDMLRRLFVFTKFLNGDYKNFDASLSFQIGVMIADIINGVYDDDARSQMIRFCLIVACFCSEHLAYDIVYTVMQGNPSGCSLTSIINGIANMIVTRLVFMRSTGMQLTEYEKHVLAKYFGDDNLIAISDFISNKMTMQAFAQVCADIGMTYTTADKTEISKPYYEHGEISFLTNQIKFVKTLDGFIINKWLALLDKETIHDIPYWSHSDPYNMRDQLNRFNMALFFARNHGREYFDYLRQAYVKCLHYVRRELKLVVDGGLFTWDNVMLLQTPEYKDYLDARNLAHRPVKLPFQDISGDTEVDKIGSSDSPFGVIENLIICANNDVINDIKIVQYSAQMENVSEHREQISNFQENEAASIGKREERISIQETSYKTDLMSFLTRPYNLGTYTWGAAASLGSVLATFVLPEVMTQNPTLQGKIDRFAFWRPSFEITIRVNGTPMHYGRLVAWWIPQANGLSSSYKRWQEATTYQWVQVDANGSNVAVIHIPYTYYSDFINVGAVEDDIATLYIAVASPLNVVGDTTPSVNFTVYGRVIEPGLSGFTFDNDYTAQMGTEINSKSVDPFIVRMPQFVKINDTPATVNGAIDATREVEADARLVNSHTPEMTIREFCQRPSLIYTGSIASTDSGTAFYTQVAPAVMYNVNYVTPGFSLTSQSLTPMAYWARYFSMWRGSLKFTISFICSNFHNMRVRIVYNPYVNSTGSVFLPTVVESEDVENIMLDLSNEKEISFEIPYQQRTPWMWNVFAERGGYGSSDYRFSTNGVWAMKIVNALTAGVDPVKPINYQIFVQAGDDFEFAYPSVFQARTFGYLAQVGTNTVDDRGKMFFMASDFETLQKVPHRLLGARRVSVKADRNLTNAITTFKELSHILSPIGYGTANTVVWSPYTCQRLRTAGFGASGRIAINYFFALLTVFRYMRGGVRIVYVPSASGQYAVMGYQEPNAIGVPYATSGGTWSPTFAQNECSMMYTSNTEIAPLDYILPFNTRYNCVTTSMSTTVCEPNYGKGVGYVNVSAMISNANLKSLYTCGANDFMVGFQLGIPVISNVVQPT